MVFEAAAPTTTAGFDVIEMMFGALGLVFVVAMMGLLLTMLPELAVEMTAFVTTILLICGGCVAVQFSCCCCCWWMGFIELIPDVWGIIVIVVEGIEDDPDDI